MSIILKRSQLNKRYGLKPNQWRDRHDDVMKYLQGFMDITEQVSDTGRFKYVIEGDLPEKGSIPPLPRRGYDAEEDYVDFIIKDLGTEYRPNSKTREAKRAILEFAGSKYGHTSEEYVRKNYAGPAMDRYGEKSGKRVWVDTRDYSPLNEQQLSFLQENLDKQCPYTRKELLTMVGQKQEFELAQVRGNFGKVLNEFKDKYGFMPYCAQEWKAKLKVEIKIAE